MISTFKLYEISNEYERAIDAFLTEEKNQESKIEEIKDLFDKKCINVAKFIKNLETEYNAIVESSKAMIDRSKKIAAHIESLKSYLQFNMEKTGLLDPIKCPEFHIKLKQNPPSLVIEDETIIPEVYIITTEVKTFDKNAMKKDILEGFEIEGARVEHKKRLEIK